MHELKKAAFDMEKPTPLLRFVVRDGARVLQQRWSITKYDEKHMVAGMAGEWRDVPIKNDDED